MFQFPYTKLPSTSRKEVYLPLAKVRLGYKRTHKILPISVVALIDSGADVCFCTKDIGTWLGIQLNKMKSEEFTAANRSKFIAKAVAVTFYSYRKEYECKFYFTEVLPKHTPIILGQIGFFDHFKIFFDYKNKVIGLE